MIKEKPNQSDIGALYVHEVARNLLVSESLVRRLLETGELPGVRIGKRWIVLKDDLAAYIESKKTGTLRVDRIQSGVET